MLDALAKSRKINEVLMHRVEQSMDRQANAFSLFQTAIGLDKEVRARTEELTQTLNRLEASTAAMQKAKDEAETANVSKTRFLASATHDLLQPLNAARLSNALLRNDLDQERTIEVSNHIERSLGHIEDLLKSILDISKLDAGTVAPELRAVSTAEIFDSITEDFKPMAEAKNLEFRIRYRGCSMLTDPKLFRRILQNLVSNAIRYTQKGGVLLTCHQIGNRVRMSVVDTGIGIAKMEQELIFNEFQRSSTADLDDELSLGLGLSIVQRLVRALDHQLTFQSKFGAGSSFSLYAPSAGCASSQNVEVTSKTNKRIYGLNDAVVLILENDREILAAMGRILEGWGCKVLLASSISEGLSSIERIRVAPDIILADYQLDDGENGIDGIAKFRERLQRETPALIISADDSPELEERIRIAGLTKLSKPVKPARLRSLMAHLLA